MNSPRQQTDARPDTITYPYSQWTIGAASRNAHWQYAEGLSPNDSFSETPPPDRWQEWFAALLMYRSAVISPGREEPTLCFCIAPAREDEPGEQEGARYLDQFAYLLDLRPGEALQFSLQVHAPRAEAGIGVEFDLKTKGEERGFIVRLVYGAFGAQAARPVKGQGAAVEGVEIGDVGIGVVVARLEVGINDAEAGKGDVQMDGSALAVLRVMACAEARSPSSRPVRPRARELPTARVWSAGWGRRGGRFCETVSAKESVTVLPSFSPSGSPCPRQAGR